MSSSAFTSLSVYIPTLSQNNREQATDLTIFNELCWHAQIPVPWHELSSVLHSITEINACEGGDGAALILLSKAAVQAKARTRRHEIDNIPPGKQMKNVLSLPWNREW